MDHDRCSPSQDCTWSKASPRASEEFAAKSGWLWTFDVYPWPWTRSRLDQFLLLTLHGGPSPCTGNDFESLQHQGIHPPQHQGFVQAISFQVGRKTARELHRCQWNRCLSLYTHPTHRRNPNRSKWSQKPVERRWWTSFKTRRSVELDPKPKFCESSELELDCVGAWNCPPTARTCIYWWNSKFKAVQHGEMGSSRVPTVSRFYRKI